MLSQMSTTGQIFPWITSQTVKLNSPIVQLFIRPFQKPWVIISDFKESQDILLRRTKEFDRSDFLGDVFVGLTPDMHIGKKSHDEKFKSNRNLIKDLMTPGFLNQVAAPQIYSKVETLVKLWTRKMSLAQGRPFSATQDIYNGTLDVIFAATFGLDSGNSTTNNQLTLLNVEGLKVSRAESIDEPVEFPQADIPPTFEAILTLTESLEASVKSPLPRLHHWVLRQFPYMRRARAIKEKLIADEIEKTVKRFTEGQATTRSALDDVLQRELNAAKKENRAPDYNSRVIYDELFGFLIGGHDTTSTTMSWGLKNLADNQDAQDTLRRSLRKAYPDAAAECRNPSFAEITKTQIPYLDATIEEVARTAVTFPGVIRNATVDSEILGYQIPKGTDVFLHHNGPDYFSAPFPIPDAKRSKSALSAKYQVGSWDPSDMASFKPERWLAKDESGKEYFDSAAGPHLAFGLGPRGCYGRRLAYLEMRIMLVMVIWNFRLLECPKSLSSHGAVDKLSRQPIQCFLRLDDSWK